MSKVFAQLTEGVAKLLRDDMSRKLVAGGLVGSLALYQAYPTLYRWELIPFVKTDAYRAKEASLDYSNLDGIIYDSYEKGTTPPRSEMLPTSRGKMIIK